MVYALAESGGTDSKHVEQLFAERTWTTTVWTRAAGFGAFAAKDGSTRAARLRQK